MHWATSKVPPTLLMFTFGQKAPVLPASVPGHVALSKKKKKKKKKTVLEKSSEKLQHNARNLSILWWRPGGGVVLPIWFPLIPGHVSHPWQVLGAGSSPLGGPRQGLFKPSPADRPQGSVGPSWLPSHLSPPGGRIPGKLETKEGRCRSPGSLSQSMKAFNKFCSSAAVEKTQEEGDLFVPQKTESSGISSPCPYPTHLAGN